MTTRRPFALAIAAIAALAAGAVAAIALLPGAGRSPPAAGAEGVPATPDAPGALPAPSAGGAAPVAPAAGFPGVSAPQFTPPAAPRQAPLPAPPEGSWSAVRIVARPQEAGPLGTAVAQQLTELQPLVAHCFDRAVQASRGAAISVVDYAPADDNGTPVLMLELESTYDQVRIVDAPVEARGGTPDGVLACAQAALRGHAFPAQGASPGKRFRMRYALAP